MKAQGSCNKQKEQKQECRDEKHRICLCHCIRRPMLQEGLSDDSPFFHR